MDGDRWRRIQTLFLEVVDLPSLEQFPFLKSAAGDDEQLIAEVQALLAEDGRPSLLDNGVAHVASRSSDLLPSCEFGPYRIRAVLGEGGMGVVYLAEREDLASLAAIKLLRDAWMSPARRERFAAEQRTLAQLTHPNIARLYDADTLADGTPWFAMEYVQGIPLTEYCRRQGSSIEQRLQLFLAVCEAVRYAHSRAIIHRDLKPANILVQSDGSVKLLDFGIAKQLDHHDEPANQTLTGLRLMTPAYAAPEQLRGEPAGTYTDVYALGVVLYELLTGRLPFDLTNRSPGEAEATILNQEPPKPSTSSDLNVLCLTAMQKDYNRRYQSVEALIRDVNHYLSREPLDARPDGLTYRLGKFVQRHRRSLAVATCALLTVAALVVFYTVRLASARNAALAEAARTQRVLRFTLNLFNGGDREVGPASDLRVTTLLDRVVVEAQSLDRDPAVQAELYETLGEVYQKLGALDRADSLLASALQRRRALSGNSDKSVAMNLVNVGLLRADEAKFEEAERLVRQGLQIAKTNLPPGHASIAAATDALGTVSFRQPCVTQLRKS
jgi:serine/threonine-protein kinase